jgi:hypothetical protein
MKYELDYTPRRNGFADIYILNDVQVWLRLATFRILCSVQARTSTQLDT